MSADADTAGTAPTAGTAERRTAVVAGVLFLVTEGAAVAGGTVAGAALYRPVSSLSFPSLPFPHGNAGHLSMYPGHLSMTYER